MTPVDLCNTALSFVGRASINSLEEATAEARACRQHYDAARRSFLSLSLWTFALRRVVLAETVNTFEARWAYRYAYPNDALRVVRLVRDEVSRQFTPTEIAFEVRERAIFAHMSPVTAEIVVDETDLARFTPLAQEALAYHLATYIARPLTKSSRLLAELKEERDRAVSVAIAGDAAQQFYHEGEEVGAYVAARR